MAVGGGEENAAIEIPDGALSGFRRFLGIFFAFRFAVAAIFDARLQWARRRGGKKRHQHTAKNRRWTVAANISESQE